MQRNLSLIDKSHTTYRPTIAADVIGVTGRSLKLCRQTHIAKMLEMPSVRSRWLEKFGRDPTELDIDRMYAKFVPKNIEALEKHVDVITNVPQTVEELRDRGIKIGSCTGFVRPILDKLMVSQHWVEHRPASQRLKRNCE